MTELIRVKDKFQITIPANLRSLLPVALGDYFEASVVDDGFLFKPVHVGQASAKPKNAKPSIIDFMRQEHAGGRSREEIDAALAAERGSWN